MRRIVAIGAVVSLALAGASARSASASHATGLERFQSCDAFVDYVSDKMLPLVTPWGFGWGTTAVPAPVGSAGTTNVTGSATTVQTGSPEVSGTNVQEAGVDEPDIVKANRSHLFAFVNNKLFAVDVRHARPQVVGSLVLDGATDQQLLLYGRHLFVLGRQSPTWAWRTGGPPVSVASPVVSPWFDSTKTVVTDIDVGNPRAMHVVGRLSLDASYVDARLVGRTARIVITSQLTARDIPFVSPTDSTPEALAAARAQNGAILKSSTAANWLPRSELGATTQPLVACDQISRPPTFSGLGLLSVLTFDLEKGLQPVDSDAIIEDGQTVYSSRDSLYVGTYPRYEPASVEPGQVTSPPPVLPAITALHKFDTSRPDVTDYRASGTVRGTVRDQWSMSEHKGALRVLSTTTIPRAESFVTVLADRDSELARIGQLGNIGRNEMVYAVRFLGDVGYVVTFRRMDPLFTLDLSDPTKPRVLGKLEIPGWSSYLHPLSDDLLLGVGQLATDYGWWQLGTQLSIFNVANLRRPTQVEYRHIGYSHSAAESDHHAFLYWPQTGLLVVPVGSPGSGRFVGALAYRVDGPQMDGAPDSSVRLQLFARLAQWRNGHRVPVVRSTVIGGTLYTVSEIGVRANDTATLADRGWAGFEEPRVTRAAHPD